MKDKIQGKIPHEIARNKNYLTSNLTKELTTVNSTDDDDYVDDKVYKTRVMYLTSILIFFYFLLLT